MPWPSQRRRFSDGAAGCPEAASERSGDPRGQSPRPLAPAAVRQPPRWVTGRAPLGRRAGRRPGRRGLQGSRGKGKGQYRRHPTSNLPVLVRNPDQILKTQPLNLTLELCIFTRHNRRKQLWNRWESGSRASTVPAVAYTRKSPGSLLANEGRILMSQRLWDRENCRRSSLGEAPFTPVDVEYSSVPSFCSVAT